MSRFLTFLALTLLVACSAPPGDEPTSDDGRPGAEPSGSATAAADGVLVIEAGSIATGPGISVEEALDQVGGGPVLVNGSLLIDADGAVLLCDALAESFPPQCAGARLEVRGLDAAGQPDLQEGNGVRWLDRTQLLGRVLAPGS